MDKILVSPSPHLHTKTSTKSLMRDVVIALLPAVLVSVLFYGWSELLILGVSVASCVLLEYLITKYLLKGTCTIGDWSAVITGVLLAIFMSNSGGAWDNAKKYIESGHYGGKGSPCHKAAVVGDTVGDPFKDTAGPSLNILIKLCSTVSIVFSGLIVAFHLL